MFDKELKLKIKIDSNNEKLVLLQDGVKTLDKSLHDVTIQANRFGRSWVDIAKGVGVFTAVNAAVSLTSGKLSDAVSSGIAYNAMIEKAHQTLTILEGSASKASSSLNWVEKFAINTPYAFKDVQDAFIKLRSYGINPTDGALQTLGDTAAAMGKPINQAVEAMADAVVGENERLKEFGIRASKQGNKIAYYWKASSGEAKNIVIANNSEIIQSTLESIFNEKYKGAMDAQAKSWDGVTSNMGASWDKFSGKLTEPVFDHLKTSMLDMTESLNSWTKALDDPNAMNALKSDALAVAGFAGGLGVAKIAMLAYDAYSKRHQRIMLLEAQLGKNAAKAQLAHATALQTAALKTKALTTVTRIGNKVLKASPYLLVAGTLATLASSLVDTTTQLDYLANGFDKAAFASKKYNAIQAKVRLIDSKDELEKLKAELAQTEANFKNYKRNAKRRGDSQQKRDAFTKYEGAISTIESKVKAYRDEIKSLNEIINSPKGGIGVKKPNSETFTGSSNPSTAVEVEVGGAVQQYQSYYEAIGDMQNAWFIKEGQLRKKNTALSAKELDRLIAIEKRKYLELDKTIGLKNFKSQNVLDNKKARKERIKQRKQEQKDEAAAQKQAILDAKAQYQENIGGAIANGFIEGVQSGDFSGITNNLSTALIQPLSTELTKSMTSAVSGNGFKSISGDALASGGVGLALGIASSAISSFIEDAKLDRYKPLEDAVNTFSRSVEVFKQQAERARAFGLNGTAFTADINKLPEQRGELQSKVTLAYTKYKDEVNEWHWWWESNKSDIANAKKALIDAQNALNDFHVGDEIAKVAIKAKNYFDQYKDLYDSLSGTDFFKADKIKKAKKELAPIIGGTSQRDLLTYVKRMGQYGDALTKNVDVIAKGQEGTASYTQAMQKIEDILGEGTTAQQAINLSENIQTLGDSFKQAAADAKASIEGLTGIADGHRSFINKNQSLLENPTQTVDRLQAQFATELSQANAAKSAYALAQFNGIDVSDAFATLKKEQADLDSVGQSLIDAATARYGSSNAGTTIIDSVLNAVKSQEVSILSLQESLQKDGNRSLESIDSKMTDLIEENQKLNLKIDEINQGRYA